VTTKPRRYDKTQARRQAKRRSLFNQMREALRAVDGAVTLDEAKQIARDGLAEKEIQKNTD
jgi:hypothetical protein